MAAVAVVSRTRADVPRACLIGHERRHARAVLLSTMLVSVCTDTGARRTRRFYAGDSVLGAMLAAPLEGAHNLWQAPHRARASGHTPQCGWRRVRTDQILLGPYTVACRDAELYAVPRRVTIASQPLALQVCVFQEFAAALPGWCAAHARMRSAREYDIRRGNVKVP